MKPTWTEIRVSDVSPITRVQFIVSEFKISPSESAGADTDGGSGIMLRVGCFLFQWLDGKEIERSERIQALQDFPEVERQVREQEKAYCLRRARDKSEAQRKLREEQARGEKAGRPGSDGRWDADVAADPYVNHDSSSSP